MEKTGKKVFKLQKRIYQAASCGDVRTVRKLQKTLLNSWSAKMVAIRRVSQNIKEIKSLTLEQVIPLVEQLKLSLKKRFISKLLRDNKSFLLYKIVWQYWIKIALEPQFKAEFKTSSFSVIPGRNCHDVTQTLKLKSSREQVLEHYRKLRDTINSNKSVSQSVLIQKLNRIIQEWATNYSAVTRSKDKKKLDHLLHLKLLRWATRRHNNQRIKKIVEKYWHPKKLGRWKFAYLKDNQINCQLLEHSKIHHKNSIKIQEKASLLESKNAQLLRKVLQKPKHIFKQYVCQTPIN